MGALPGAKPAPISARKRTGAGRSGGQMLKVCSAWERPPGGSLESGLGRGPPEALSLGCEDPLHRHTACGSEGSEAPTWQGSWTLPPECLLLAPHSLLEYDMETKEVKVLLDQLRFPNGVQLSPEEDFVLVAETTMARIRRCVRQPAELLECARACLPWPGQVWARRC